MPSGRPFLQGQCKACRIVYMADWRAKQTPEQREKKYLQDRKSQLQQKYGISQADYDTLLASQDGKCAICDGTDLSGRRLSVDHDHASGAVRGLLCHPCNVAIGLLKDDVQVLERAIEYLARDTRQVASN